MCRNLAYGLRMPPAVSAELNMIQISKPDFPIGKLLATPAALEALQEADVDIIDLVARHISKD